MIIEIKNALNYKRLSVFIWERASYPQCNVQTKRRQQGECVDSVCKRSVKDTVKHRDAPDKVPLILVSSQLVNVPQPLASTLFAEAGPSQLSKA